MESSSNDSFAWTEASEDSTDSVEMAVVASGKAQTQSDNDSEYGKKYKKKLQKDLFPNLNNVEQKKVKKRKLSNEKPEEEWNDSPKKKKIKIETESDNEVSKNKYKPSQINYLGKASNELQSSDESYLNMRVKEEVTFTLPAAISPKQNETRKGNDVKVKVDNELCTELDEVNDEKSPRINNLLSSDISDMHQITDTEISSCKGKKKKKTKKRKQTSEAEGEDDVNIEDMCDLENGVVENYYISNNNQGDNSLENSKKDYSNSMTRTYYCNSDVDDKHDNGIKEQNQKSNLRISDRIRFEDEDDLDNDISTSDKIIELSSKKVDKFIKTSKTLKPISRKFNRESILTEDDDIWVVHCPRDISIERFKDINIPLNKKCKIKIEGSSYEGNIENSNCSIIVMSQMHGQLVLRNIPSHGTVNISKRVPKARISYDTMMLIDEIDSIPLPETKIRHPLFGSNYKKAIKLSASVKEKLAACKDQNMRDESKKTKKLMKTVKHIKINEVEPVCSDNHKLEDVITKKENKKRKQTKYEQQPHTKKVKRKKHNMDSADVWDSEKAIEKSLFHF